MLDFSFSVEDIQFNEPLIWTIYASEGMSIGQMKAALF